MHRSGQRRVLPMVNQHRLPGELGRSAPALSNDRFSVACDPISVSSQAGYVKRTILP